MHRHSHSKFINENWHQAVSTRQDFFSIAHCGTCQPQHSALSQFGKCFAVGPCPVHYRKFHSLSGLPQLDAKSSCPTIRTMKNCPRHGHIPPLRDKIVPFPIESHHLILINFIILAKNSCEFDSLTSPICRGRNQRLGKLHNFTQPNSVQSSGIQLQGAWLSTTLLNPL